METYAVVETIDFRIRVVLETEIKTSDFIIKKGLTCEEANKLCIERFRK